MPDTKTIEVTTRNGRRYVIRELNGLESLDAFLASGNDMTLNTMIAAFAIVSIDGEKAPVLANSAETEAFLDRLPSGDLMALMRKYQTTFMSERPDVTDDGPNLLVKFKNGRTFGVREMTSRESMIAYKAAVDPFGVSHFIAAYSLCSINGAAVDPPTSAKEARARLRMLSDSETRNISTAYERFAMTDDDLKNESEPESSQPSLLP